MQYDEFMINTCKAIRNKCGDIVSDFGIYDVVDEPSNWSFKIVFTAYNYFDVVFSDELDNINFSLEFKDGKTINLLNSHSRYTDAEFDKCLKIMQENLELRIPDKYLIANGWK